MNPDLRNNGPRAVAMRDARGFTMVELMVTLVVLAVVMVALTAVMLTALRSKVSGSNNVEANQSARTALDMMARDLRSAGYGVDLDNTTVPQPPIAYIDSLQVLINANLRPYPDASTGDRGLPLAYNPAGAPKPYPLAGTAWQPPSRYVTGAEVIRWTLDANNDGLLDDNDHLDPNGQDARRTVNPNDFELIRQVYGDSTNLVAGNNGGNTERVALVMPPGGSVPPMFQVYLRGSTTPWDWSNGPIPPGELRNIVRVTVQVTSGSARADWRGQFARTTFRSDVSSMRNVPDFGAPEFPVDGYVYKTVDYDATRDPVTEPGIAGARVTLGALSTVTGSTGYFLFQVPAGTYTLRHIPPPGYGVYTSPDSYVVTVGPGVTKLFADTARAGGFVHVHVFDDLDGDGTQQFGENGRSWVRLAIAPDAVTAYTDSSGDATLFAPVGAWSVTCTPPDSFRVTNTNPQTGVMTDGGTASILFGVSPSPVGSFMGVVWKDVNNDGNRQGSEVGVDSIWVGATDDGGTHILGFAYTDAAGAYEIKNVPINDPPKTTPYSVFIIPRSGFYPTTPTSINGQWLQASQVLNNRDFGLNSFTRIKLDATRVLCLGSRDLVEKDWSGTQSQNRRMDQDLILGADAGGTDQVSVWFNPYSNPFSGSPSYTRTAPNAVLALALDTLTAVNAFRRPDLVTGTKYSASGNFFVWLMQNSSGNEGFYPNTFTGGKNYKTQDQGDVTSVLTADCAGGAGADMPDIIVGTKSPTAGYGSVEIWRSNNNLSSPSFSREEILPPSGGLPVGWLGEVTSMALADFDLDGVEDLVVSTRKSDYTGQLVFLKGVSKTVAPRFQALSAWIFGSDIPTQVAPVDVDHDGRLDVVLGTQNSTSGGALYYLRNSPPPSTPLTFAYIKRVDAPGIVTAITAADYGGATGNDVAIGYRSNTSSYAGGVRIYFLDLGTLPNSGVDPSAGFVTNWAPALSPNNFNYGTQPSLPPPPYLTDLAAGVKIDANTGALWIFIR